MQLAHRIIGYYDRLNDQLHKAQGELVEQITRTQQAEAVAKSEKERAQTSERLRVENRAKWQACQDQPVEARVPG